jgi:hypothetical protein
VLLGGVPRPARSCKCCRLWLVPLLSPARKPQLASLLSATTAKGPVITLHLVPFPTFNHPLPITSPEDGEQTLHWHLSACWVPLWTLPSLHRALPRCQDSLPRSLASSLKPLQKAFAAHCGVKAKYVGVPQDSASSQNPPMLPWRTVARLPRSASPWFPTGWTPN